MFFTKTLPILSMAIAVCQGLPSNTLVSDIAPRDYKRQFFTYQCDDCSCGEFLVAENFGCGGSCYVLPPFTKSVGLSKVLADPKSPTASIRSHLPCLGAEQSVGIHSFQTWGCTNINIASGTTSLSANLFYGC